MNLRRFIPIKRYRDPPPVVAVLPLAGVIGRVGPLRQGLQLRGLEKQIERAFSLSHVAAVALAINSPGGSAVQSAQIFARIRALAEEKDVPVYAFAEDVAASGGYWLALAGDEIYADTASIVGSIGVLFQSFGLNDAIARLGIERRVHTAGERKGALDAFRPENPDDVAMLESVQEDIHEAFMDMVRDRRGDRLKGEETDLFSGAFWSGKRAMELGLIDGIGDLRTVMRTRFGDRVRFKPVDGDRRWWRGRLGVRGTDPLAIGEGVIAAVEERLIWSRYGL
jgi:signal peptide peptidase SppA